jgi:hypothetical protein
MRIITTLVMTCGLAAALLTIPVSGSIAAPKSKTSGINYCDQNACVQRCIQKGGQLRFCPQYCEGQIRKNPKCK